MINRRGFIGRMSAGAIGIIATLNRSNAFDLTSQKKNTKKTVTKPLVISTWKHGLPANEVAYAILKKGGKAIDAVEKGARVPEDDPEVTSVGYGGLPDRDGFVTLDACIMDENGNCGSVAFLQEIKNPVSVARLVMDKTPHIMLVGDGALKLALDNGFKKMNLLTEKSKAEWQKWLQKNDYKPIEDFHDTIGILAIDNDGNLSGACTTSGLPFKYHGRVGDSPIIGAGLFVDNKVGAACATGQGEEVMRVAGTAYIVDLMREGLSPQQACQKAVERISQNRKVLNFQVGFLALNKYGETGAYSLEDKFEYALYKNDKNELIKSDFWKR
jgi:N4-(beta-N-acetylglucosaminyl)-L-asparaginase